MGPRDQDPMKFVRSAIRRMSATLASLICWRAIKITLWSLVVAVIAMTYYFYLDSLYLVDEVYEGDKLRELAIEEKFTIRSRLLNDKDQLKKFILHYSICQQVEEIRIIWDDKSSLPPSAKSFPYSKTHSRVTYEYPQDSSIQSLLTDGMSHHVISTKPHKILYSTRTP
jgi:hypothetical protein